jgi:hypothetical protein
MPGQVRFYPSNLGSFRNRIRRQIVFALYSSLSDPLRHYRVEEDPEALAEAGKIMAALSRRGLLITEAGRPDPAMIPVIGAAIHDGCRARAAIPGRISPGAHQSVDCPYADVWLTDAEKLYKRVGDYLAWRAARQP